MLEFKMYKYTIALVVLIFTSTTAFADSNAPWGRGKLTPTEYRPQKVVYDVTTGKLEIMDHVLDRASYLSTITGANPFDQSIVLVLHGSAIKFFAIKNTGKFKQLLVRDESLVSGEVLKLNDYGLKVVSEQDIYYPIYLSSRYAFEPGSSDFKYCKVTGFPIEALGNDDYFLSICASLKSA